MAVTQITEPSQVNLSITEWTNFISKDTLTSKGMAQITLSSYSDGSTAPTVQAGGIFENNGSYFKVNTDTTPTGFAGISNSTQAYIVFDISATALIYSDAAPTWSDAKQGWYNGNDRYLFAIYKDSGGEYDNRSNIPQRKNDKTYGDREIIGDIEITSNAIYGAKRSVNFLHEDASFDTVFHALDPFIPNVGDSMLITGSRELAGTGLVVFSRAVRTGASAVTLYGMETVSATPALDEIEFADGGASSAEISIAW